MKRYLIIASAVIILIASIYVLYPKTGIEKYLDLPLYNSNSHSDEPISLEEFLAVNDVAIY
jgi:hypothetical protein